MSLVLCSTNRSFQAVHVSKPQAGESISIARDPGAKIVLGFDPATAAVSRAGNDLVFDLADDSKVTLSDFLVMDEQPLPSLVLPDGNEVDFAGFLTGFNIEFETAAGSATGPNASGSGEGQYADNPGSLIDGIERLGSLGTDYWGRATEAPVLYQGQGDPFSADATTSRPPSPKNPRPITEIKVEGYTLLVHEDGLSWGTQAGDAAHPTSTSGYVGIESLNGIESIAFTAGASTYVITLPAGWDGSAYFPPVMTGSFSTDLGAMVIDQIVLNTTTGKYEAHFTYTLKGNTLAHSDVGDGLSGEHHDLLSKGDAAAKAAMPEIGVVVTDTAGNSSNSSTIIIDIHDDGPKLALAHADTGYNNDQGFVDDSFVHLDNSYMTTGMIEPNYGADRAYGDDDDCLTVSFAGTRSVMVNGVSVGNPVASDEPIVVQFDGDGKATVYTGLGMIEFTRQAGGSISYRYIAKHGLKGDSEEITFTVMDGDEDVASRSVSIKMDHDVPAGTSYVDEAGLAAQGPGGYEGLGSFHAGYEAASQTFTVFLPEGTTGFAWDMVAISTPGNAFKADANGDGEYTQVDWSVDANGDLIAMAEGETILRVSPPESGGNGLVLLQDGGGDWYGTMEVTLEYPIQHHSGDGYNVLGLYLSFDATSPGENGGPDQVTSNAVSVAVIDDAPSARERTLEVVEAVKTPEDVYLIMDVSSSINTADLKKGMLALRDLVEKYVSKGIEATFTLATFGYEAREWGTHLSAADMLTVLNAGLGGTDSDIASYWRAGVGGNTNYDSALDMVQHLITAAQQDGALRYYDQKVYFISDGVPNAGIDRYFDSWKSFIQKHGADAGNERVEVYAVGVGSALNNSTSWNNLMQVTNDGPEHGIKVNKYEDLADQLAALIEPGKTTGNLLGVDIDNNDTRSADLTTVVSVEVNDVTYKVQDNGATVEITIATGVTLTVYANGDYTITSTKSVDSDQTYSLKYTIKDADGDTSTADLQLVLKDAKPEAFDNVAGEAVTYIAGEAIILDDFDTDSGWLSANRNTLYNQTRTGTYTGIDGNNHALTGDVSFVKILPIYNSVSSVSFDKALSYVTGHVCAQTFNTTDSPRSGSYIEKSFDLLAKGTVTFNYIFTHGTGGDVSTQEKAFWVLLDENGNVYGSGLITSADATSSGVISIPVKDAGQYTLVLGCYDMYIGNNTMPTLYVDQVVYVPADSSDIYNGNVIEDKSPLGITDNLADHATLHKIRFTDMGGNNREYTVGAGVFAAGLLVLENIFAAGDKLTINDNGNYVYQTKSGSSFDTVNIEYSIKEPGSDDSDWATLYIRSGEYRFEGADDAAQHTDGNDVIIGKDGGVTLDGGGGNDVIYGGDGNDIIYGGDGNDVIYGGTGNDVIYGGDGNDVIYGGTGNDIIYGGDGNDVIYGGTGNDIICGGMGNDTLYGGSGSDIFAWKAQDFDDGRDVIMDFTLREDRLSFADIFGVGEQNHISVKTILDALNQGWIDISATSETLLTVSVDDGFNTQNVDIHLSGSSLSSEQMAGISADDDAAKAALLQQMLTSITC